ncbi:MAG: CoA transferase [Pseudomonadota bacterium]|uniref:CoA transferase n=1 Tax=Polaromonas sp. TaxID=1869339 RepID=UPI0017BF0301|nr:CoA transferase [Polaromonas sp.]MBA3593101.1 CoA transferase [Polaromonas sp.]MDQ3271042.1 CoA transferase [Pseudomonadota bacterium]
MPSTPPSFQPLQGTRILSLALNLPGPAALMRCRQMGATCVKLEPPAGDPMGLYNKPAYAQLHEGVKVLTADLKSEAGQKMLHRELEKTDVLLTSFRPSAIEKLDLGWKKIHSLYPALSHVAIVGAPGALGEEPGHDLTYMAHNDLLTGMDLPPTLYADMSGSLMASEAVLQAALRQREPYAGTGEPHPQGVFLEVALSEAASYLGLPRQWGLTQPTGSVGGAHAGYRVYACKDGRAAVAALEPHFAAALCEAAGVQMKDMTTMFASATHQAVAAFMLTQTREQLDKLAQEKDIPLHTLSNQ